MVPFVFTMGASISRPPAPLVSIVPVLESLFAAMISGFLPVPSMVPSLSSVVLESPMVPAPLILLLVLVSVAGEPLLSMMFPGLSVSVTLPLPVSVTDPSSSRMVWPRAAFSAMAPVLLIGLGAPRVSSACLSG